MSFRVPEPYRLRTGPMATDRSFGNNGAFVFRSVIAGRMMAVIASDGANWQEAALEGEPWEHVSVHCFRGKKQFTPTWIEMCAAKDMFWDEDDVVIQFHPRKTDYVNNHIHTLHLWRPVSGNIPTPPTETVGIKDAGVITSPEQARRLAQEFEDSQLQKASQ